MLFCVHFGALESFLAIFLQTNLIQKFGVPTKISTMSLKSVQISLVIIFRLFLGTQGDNLGFCCPYHKMLQKIFLNFLKMFWTVGIGTWNCLDIALLLLPPFWRVTIFNWRFSFSFLLLTVTTVFLLMRNEVCKCYPSFNTSPDTNTTLPIDLVYISK